MDYYYSDHRSIWFEFIILLKTPSPLMLILNVAGWPSILIIEPPSRPTASPISKLIRTVAILFPAAHCFPKTSLASVNVGFFSQPVRNNRYNNPRMAMSWGLKEVNFSDFIPIVYHIKINNILWVHLSNWVSCQGFEPWTLSLRGICSTIELAAPS